MKEPGAFLVGFAPDPALMDKDILSQVEGAPGDVERSASLRSLTDDDGGA